MRCTRTSNAASRGCGGAHDYNGLVKKTNISTLKRDLSRYIEYVRKGGTVRIFDRDNPVADIVPLERREKYKDEEIEALMQRLERQGTVEIRGAGRFDMAKLGKPVKTKASVVAAIIDERREGR